MALGGVASVKKPDEDGHLLGTRRDGMPAVTPTAENHRPGPRWLADRVSRQTLP
jgi:hypothetical protein